MLLPEYHFVKSLQDLALNEMVQVPVKYSTVPVGLCQLGMSQDLSGKRDF